MKEMRKRRWRRRTNKTVKLEREEKQSSGMKVSPFESIVLIEMNKERKLKEMMNNKQRGHILIAGVQKQRSEETLSVKKSERNTIRMRSTT